MLVPRPICLELSFAAIRHNLDQVIQRLERIGAQRACARPRVWGVIKANAYGHGLESAVTALARADGLAMLDLDEAVRAREAGWAGPLLLLEGFFQSSDIAILEAYELSVVIHCAEQLTILERSGVGPGFPAWVKLNAGMNRLGFLPADFARAWGRAQTLRRLGRLSALGKMTHFSRADDDADVTAAQRQCFLDVTRDLPGPVSLCNSAATLADVWASADILEPQWVRPGICLYGGSPFADRTADSFGLLPAQTLRSRLIAVHALPAGAPIGYGHQFVTPAPMRVGIVACGYADGYPRHAPTGTPVTVDGVATRLLGRVSMDMLAVDLDAVPQAVPGTPVVLWGQGGPSADAVAQAAGTISYALMCAVAPRVPRQAI